MKWSVMPEGKLELCVLWNIVNISRAFVGFRIKELSNVLLILINLKKYKFGISFEKILYLEIGFLLRLMESLNTNYKF
jgi:hypothetical protein